MNAPTPTILRDQAGGIGALDLAAMLAIHADRYEDILLDVGLVRECWEARVAQNKADYWKRRECEI